MVSVLGSTEEVRKNKKIVFDEDGEEIAKDSTKRKNKKKSSKIGDGSLGVKTGENSIENITSAKEDSSENADSSKKWYQVYPQFPATDEILDMKDSEQMELHNLCRTSYEQEKSAFMKKNPSDSRWLQTALHKGTAKDRANAGALLVTSNPLANLEALSTLVGSTKLSNKSCVEVIVTLCDLWKEVLLPYNRKLYSVQMRGADWKLVRKSETLSKEQQKKIYAYWHFENELKDLYFEFLKNLQQGIQTGQENNKTAAINTASQLLTFAPEKEQMLLTMLINKLGDPVAKIASKALHHLTDVAHKHPNMCGIIVSETEKLLFRNNVSERAQHFALCYLAGIAPAGRPEVCTKLVNICFALFKVLVQKGCVNSRTMQAILRCLQKAIVDAKPAADNAELLTKDMQDTIYRLVHLADIRVSVQTLGLLLQLVTVKTEKSDRFYNALYKKLLDLNLTTIGSKTAAQLLHILHRAIYIDSNLPRARAFLKRFLQLALCAPPNVAAGCLIVIQKIHQTRKELCPGHDSEANGSQQLSFPKILLTEDEMKKFDSDGEEKYEDVIDSVDVKNDNNEEDDEKTKKPDRPLTTIPSWHHSKVTSVSGVDSKTRDMAASKYDPYHRVPTFAGAEFALQNELILLSSHYHPTIQVFAESILNNKRIDYYGDPLRDFGLAHFLERFSFKNPKKLDTKTDTTPVIHKPYISYGARGVPVKSLTKNNCSEEEMFIFNYLEEKRNQSSHIQKTKKSEDSDDEDTLKAGDVDDDEFEDYLDGFFGKKNKSKKSPDEDISDDEELDFLKDLGGERNLDAKEKKTQRKKKDAENNDNDDDVDGDWGDDDDNADFEGSENSDDEEGSIDFNEVEDDDEDDDNGADIDNEDDDDDDDDDMNSIDDSSGEELSGADSDDVPRSKSKKLKRDASSLDERSFAKKLKHSDDLTSLFAAADDFAELLEETGKTKGQGTSNAVFNKDKSTAKQLMWEEKRRSGSKTYGNKSKQKGKYSKRK